LASLALYSANTPQEVWGGKVPELTGFQETGCHIVFDIKMDFTWKARFVASGHTTEAPSSLTYLSVVSHGSIWIAFLIVVLNDLDIMSCDLENAYLNAPCHEKIWFEGGLECGEDKGKVCIIIRSLYGLKSATAAFRAALCSTVVARSWIQSSEGQPGCLDAQSSEDGWTQVL
jgi:Reverse transcriptase (RNA-dependent DNA polymerase)